MHAFWSFLITTFFFCFCLGTSCSINGQNTDHPLNVLVIVPGTAGHSRVLVRLIRELQSRGHKPVLMSDGLVEVYSDCTNIESYIVPLDVVPINKTQWDTITDDMDRMGVLEGCMYIFSEGIPPVDIEIVKYLNRTVDLKKFDVAVVDVTMAASTSFLMSNNVPVVINYPMAYSHGPNYPPMLSNHPISIQEYVKYPRRIIAHFEALYETMYIVYTVLTNRYIKHVVSLEALGKSQQKALHVVTNVRGFDFQSAAASVPHVYHVGPIIDEQKAKNETILHEALPELTPWLQRYNSSEIVYVAFGTTGTLTSKAMHTLISGLLMAQSNRNISVIMALRDKNYDMLESLKMDLPDSIFITNKFAPQLNILALPSVKYFITHCGMNSAQEGLYFRKRLIGMPFSFDQYNVAQLLENSQLGVGLYKTREGKEQLTVEKIVNAIELTATKPYRRAVSKLRKVTNHSGGLKRYADLVEMVGDIGDIDHLQVDPHYTFIQSNKLDLIAVYSVLLYLIYRVIRWTISFCCNCLLSQYSRPKEPGTRLKSE